MVDGTGIGAAASNLPQEHFSTYLHYKQSTRAIVKWLLKDRGHNTSRSSAVTIQDLRNIAFQMQSKAFIMPDIVDFHFRSAIRSRHQLSKYFRSQDTSNSAEESNESHDFFTQMLSEIYQMLREHCARAQSTRRHPIQRRIVDDKQSQCPNMYETLGIFVAKQPSCEKDRPVSMLGECCSQSRNLVQERDCTSRLIDDRLGDAFELHGELQDVVNLLQTIGQIGERVSRSKMPLVVGAFLTNAALALFERIQKRMALTCDASDPRSFLGKCSDLLESLEQTPNSISDIVSAAKEQVSTMRSIWGALTQLREDLKQPVAARANSTVDPLPHLQERKTIESNKPNDRDPIEILSSIANYFRHNPHPTDLIRDGTPLYVDISCCLGREHAEINDVRCTFGLQILMESLAQHRSHKCDKRTGALYRLSALKFAQEVFHSINPILEDSSMPCRCTRTLAFHLENLKREISAFLCEKNFSLAFQSPWVCGSHILEMLETCFYYGLRLLSYRNYVGSVLHTYNVVKVAAAFEEVPMLEALLTAYGGVIFPAGQPTRNFWASWTRFTGCRLSFKSSKTDHRSGNHHMMVPAHAAREAVGFDGTGLRKEANDSRFQYRRISLFYHVKETNYVLDSCLSESTHIGSRCTEHTSGFQKKHSGSEAPSSASEHILRLESRISNEFTGQFPVAKINLFKVYLACVKMIDIVTKRLHAGDQPDRCICFIRELALAADHARDHGRVQQPLGRKDIVEAFAEAVREVLHDKSYHEFLWENI